MISEGYRRLQQLAHEDPHYGIASRVWGGRVAHVLRQFNARRLLDYGCGKGMLRAVVESNGWPLMEYRGYDPAVPANAATPKPCEAVACIDVLEHVELEFLDVVLDDLRRVVLRVGVFTIGRRPAERILADGRNAHLIVEPLSWWFPKIVSRFDVHMVKATAGAFFFVVQPLGADP